MSRGLDLCGNHGGRRGDGAGRLSPDATARATGRGGSRPVFVLGAFCGSMLGAKLPFLLSDWSGTGGRHCLAVRAARRSCPACWEVTSGCRLPNGCWTSRSTCATALPRRSPRPIAVGRLGCFHAGCCYGSVTSVPWGVDFGDGQLRHPTQLYESLFHLLAAVTLYQLYRRQLFRGQHIRLYFLAYFCYRFLTEFIRPESRTVAGPDGLSMGSAVPRRCCWSCGDCPAVVRSGPGRGGALAHCVRHPTVPFR